MSPKISVISPTIRKGGLELVTKALKRQTIGFEWIVGCPFKPETPLPHKWVEDPPKKKGDYWAIYKNYNAMLREATGDLIVTWQDCTYTNPDTLERFLFHYKRDPKTIVGAVGNKYADEDWQVKIWQDPRQRSDYGSFYEVYFNDIELNLASFPKQAFYDVGGFDEYLDKYSSLCGYDVLDRLNDLGGWNFKLDQSINSFSTEHGRLPEWEENSPWHGAYDKRKRDLKNVGKWPILDYL